jgi:hypothetical protein
VLTPAVTSQVAASQLELELSPTVTRHVAPWLQFTLHDMPHAPVHELPIPQFTIWLGMFGIVHA